MKYNISHIILPMILGMASSCTSDPLQPEQGDEMRFEVSEAASRGSLTTDANLTENPFMLFGDLDTEGVYYENLKILFNGEKLSYKNNNWNYGIPIYWLMGKEHSFVAIHPHYDSARGITDLTYSDSKLAFTYSLPKNADGIVEYADVKDLLVATHRRKYNFDTAGPVKLGFRHILSRINIEPALDEVLMYEDETDRVTYPYNEDEYILFHKIEIFGLKTKASFSYVPAALPSGKFLTDDKSSTYQVDDNSAADAVLTFNTPKKVTNNKKNVNICDDADALFVLPQSVNSDAKLILYYTVNDDFPQRKITFPLSNLIGKWDAEKVYTYKFSISKAYTGQIKDGSVTIEIDHYKLPDNVDDSWVNDDDPIRFDFDGSEGESN